MSNQSELEPEPWAYHLLGLISPFLVISGNLLGVYEPIYAAMGINDKVLLTQDFYKKSFSVQEFEEKAVHVKEFVNIISNICLNKGT